MMRCLILTGVFVLTIAVGARAETPCGGQGQVCCSSDPQCGPHLTCTIFRTCQCGGQAQACCGSDPQCGPHLTCAEGTCRCGGEGQACCEKTGAR
jgi:hypothetical protein